MIELRVEIGDWAEGRGPEAEQQRECMSQVSCTGRRQCLAQVRSGHQARAQHGINYSG